MGSPKQLIEVEGQTLIHRTVRTALASLAASVVVTTSDNGVDFEAELHGQQWTRALVENPQLGQSQSIKAGLATAESLDNIDAVLFTPCDLPLLSTSHLNDLITTYQSGLWKIVTSCYDDVLGAPLIVARELWPELHALEGDVGARKILPLHRQSTTSIPWQQGQFDLDTPADVTKYTQRKF